MKTEFLTGTKTATTLAGFVEDSEEISFAVAWGTPNTVASRIKQHESKIRHGVFGTHLFQTSPAVLEQFTGSHAVKYLPPSGALFHPKIYLFKLRNRIAAVVGSHNMTAGAFDKGNIEASLLLVGDEADTPFTELAEFIREHWQNARRIADDDFLFEYRVRHASALRMQAKAQPAVKLSRPKNPSTLSPLVLTWADFIKGVQDDRHHSLEGRLAVLEMARVLFAEKRFEQMSVLERKAIAGTYGKKEPRLGDLDWAWFGSMIGQGDFNNLVTSDPKLLSQGLDQIPSTGDVAKEHYSRFIDCFNRAFSGKTHKGGYATASRLLAMKRPDWFIAINQGNRDGLGDAFGVAVSTLDTGNYWERIVIPLVYSDWWNQDRPTASELEGRLWDSRAAMLDSLYYTGLGSPNLES